MSQIGHRDYFSKDANFNNALMSCMGHEKKRLYAWVKSDGELLCVPDDNLDKILSMRSEMQEECINDECFVFLDSFFYENTCEVLHPPFNEVHCQSGHAMGGPRTLETAEDALEVFKEILEYQYAGYKDTKFYIEKTKAVIEKDNVRAWVVRSNDLGLDKPLDLPFRWSAHVTMINDWNEDYHDVHLGNFRYEYDAIEEAFTAFIRYQVIEKRMDEY